MPAIAPSQEIAIRAVGMALAGLSIAFAVYMLAYGGGKMRVNGVEYLAIFAQPRGSTGEGPAVKAAALRSVAAAPVIDTATTGSLAAPAGKAAPDRRPVEIVGARADRVWLRIDGAIRSAAPGDSVAGLGRISAIVAHDGGWVVLDDKGATLLSVAKGANGAPLFTRKMIFE
jgi:hypothetical protein